MTRERESNKALMAWLRKQENGEEAWLGNVWAAAVEWADSHPNWIPVEREKPRFVNTIDNREYSKTVLVINEWGGYSSAVWVHDKRAGWYGWYHGDEEEIGITHWMPMPKPPRKEE